MPNEKVKLVKNKFALTCSFRKEIHILTLSRSEKFDDSFYFKIHGTVHNLIASSISFNLIEGLHETPLKVYSNLNNSVFLPSCSAQLNQL